MVDFTISFWSEVLWLASWVTQLVRGQENLGLTQVMPEFRRVFFLLHLSFSFELVFPWMIFLNHSTKFSSRKGRLNQLSFPCSQSNCYSESWFYFQSPGKIMDSCDRQEIFGETVSFKGLDVPWRFTVFSFVSFLMLFNERTPHVIKLMPSQLVSFISDLAVSASAIWL